MVWWKMVASVVAFLLGVGVSAPALDELNATWVDKAVAASQTVESGEGAEDNSEYRKSNTPKVVGAAETPESVTATPGTQSEIAKVVPAVETNLETTVTPVAEWPEGGFTGETTVTYDANGRGSFADGATTNAVTTKYDGFKGVTKYAHTDNLDDAGGVAQNGGYGNNKSYSRVVTIPGASSLTVDITYQTESTRYDWVCAYAGGTESSPAGDAQCSAAGSLTGKLGDKTKTTKSFTVDGDSVTFWFRSDSSGSNYYGYYAVVKGLVGSKETVSGTYAAPVDPSGEYKLSSWNTKPDGTGENLGAGEVYSPSSQTVYAQWELNYTKWNTVGWRITDDGVLKIRPWEGDTGTTGSTLGLVYSTIPWYNQASKIKKIESTGTIVLNASSAGLFYDCSNLTDISALADWDVSNVTDMLDMFNGCSILTDLTPLKSWDVSNVKEMRAMFLNCSSLTDLTGLANWNVSNVTSMMYMFSYCSSLTDLTALANWNVSNVTEMSLMFDNCSKLTNLTALASWNVSKVTGMGYMFRSCSSLIDLTALASWNVSSVSISHMFFNCSKLTDLTPLKPWNVSKVKYMSYMFSGCSSLTDLTPITGWNVSNVTDMDGMFNGCSKLTDLTPLASWNVSKVTDMSHMFSDWSNLTNLTALASWNVSNVTSMNSMFSNCSSLTDLTALASWNVSKVTDMNNMFSYCSSLTDLTALASWDVSNVTSMNSMFSRCSSLTDLTALASWNVSKVTDMGYMFRSCSSLTNLTALASWNVSNVTFMYAMFAYCSNIQKVGIPSIANGGQNLLNKANDASLTRYMPIIISDDFTMGPYPWSDLQSEMQTNPDAFQEGTIWVRYTPSYFLDFNPNGGIGSTKSLMTPLAGTATLPDSTFLRFGYKFIGWTTQPDPISDVNPLMKPGQQFRPASPTDAARYTLYAQWEKLFDTSNLPESSQAGILPGWVQVGSENTNGLIPPMDMAIASFINKYSPDQTSITFRFLKLLDGNVPSASDTFTFDMHDESGKLVQTATNVGSTITFAPLGFDKAGVFTYFISERQDPSNKINEDDNVIQATVTVVEEDGKLKATAQLLGETTFRNETKPAELTISKKVVLPEWSDITDDDQKTFKFHVTLKKDASPLSGTFDGVTFDESGTATIEVKGNTQKTIKGIPAGTTYTVNEVDIPQGYSNTDKTNTNGNLLADSSVTSEWENTYTPVDATVQLQASKKYFDQSNTEFNLKGGEFGFSACEIIDSNTSTGCVTATNDRTGKVEFPVLTYSTPGIHTYRITEDVTSTDKSIAFDRKAYTVTVEVSDNGEGSLVSKVQYNTADGSVPVFVNRNTVMSALPVTGSYAVWAVVFAAVVSVVWFAAPGRRRQ